MNEYETFDLDQEDDSNLSPASPLKERTQQINDKYVNPLTKNFLHIENIEHEDTDNFAGSQNSIVLTKSGIASSGKDRRRHRRNESIKLEPIQTKQTIEKTQVFTNYNKNVMLEIDDNDLNDEKRQQIELSDEQGSPVAFKKKQNEELRPKKSAREVEINIFNIESNQPSRQQGKANITFLYQDEEIIEDKANNQPPIASPMAIPRNNNDAIFMHSSDSQLSDGEPIIINESKQYFNLSNRTAYKEQLTSLLKFNHQFRMELQRDNSGFNTFWPEFKLVFKGEDMGILHAKRTTARPISTFIISLTKTDFEECSDNYMGKIKSNVMGDVLNIFSAGPSPKVAKEKSVKPRQLLATIVYQTNMFQSGKPRQFFVYIKKKQFDYYKDFKGMKLYDGEIGFNQLFVHEENRNKLVLFQNRKPVWNETIGGHMLNFRGRVGCASIKNFILEDPQGRQAILFGKKDENDFTMEISDTISPYLAFCIALSAFDSKLICE